MKRERQSWAEEHKELVRRASNMRIGNKWILRFYQVIRDKDPPNTKLKDNDLTEFLVPESHLSLKLYFDNLRNYGICAAFAALGSWIWIHSPNVLPSRIPIWISPSIAIAVWALVGVLLLFNCVQTWVLTRELYLSLRAMQVAKFHVYRGGNFVQYVLSLGHLIVTFIVDMMIWVFALIIGAALIAICLGFVAYAVLWRQAIQ